MKGHKAKDFKSMDKAARVAKMKELKLELAKSSMRSSKTHLKTKEIKKAIARLLTLTNADRKRPLAN